MFTTTVSGRSGPAPRGITALPPDLLVVSSPVPAYHRLARAIAALIHRGLIQAGEQLPSEYSLAETLHTSRPTVRRALAELAAENLIAREHGKGTYVLYPPRPGAVGSLVGLGDRTVPWTYCRHDAGPRGRGHPKADR